MTHLPSKLKYFLLITFFHSVILSQTIETIKINGAENFSERDYLNWIALEGSKLFVNINDTISKRITSKLSDFGYFNPAIKNIEQTISSDSQKVDLVISIKEGVPTEIYQFYFEKIDSAENEFLQSNVDFLKQKVFNKLDLEDAIANIISIYEEQGFPFINIKIESIYFFENENTKLADIYLSIDKGETSIINNVRINGNDKTKDYVITREIRFTPGEKYSQKKIDDIPKILNRLRFFEPIETPQFYFDSNDKGILQIKIKEKETNNFDGIVGYVPSSNDNESGFFTGFVNISLRNLFGTGRAAAIRWQQEDRNSQELELKYLEPWMFNYPFNLSLGLFQRKQDTTYVQRKFNTKIEFLATEEISASFLFETESTIPTDNGTNVFTVFNSTSISTGVNLMIDTRDDVYSPTEGILFENTYIFKSKKIDGPSEFITSSTEIDISHQRLELDFSFYQELFNRNIAALTLHAREMRGGFFEISDLYKLGGTNTLRGYRENQFLGNRIFWSNIEYRYLLSQRSFAFLFFDSGYYLRNDDAQRNIPRNEAFKIGYGLGMNLETGLGVMRVSYALGKGDSFSEGKIHFGLLNEF